MNVYLAAVAFLVLVAVAAYVIHRLNLQHADRIAVYRYSSPLPGRRGRVTPQPPSVPDPSGSATTGGRREHRARGSARSADGERG